MALFQETLVKLHGIKDYTDINQEGEFSLIHVPLPLYSSLLQPILRVLLPHKAEDDGEEEDHIERLSTDSEHGFLNISVTPIECSIVCQKSWAETIFQPVIEALPKDEVNQVQISADSYIVFSVNSTGTDAGQRVMDLTSPLAMAGIPIFFITTYYTDFILVPSKDRQTVGAALLARGFEFSEEQSAYVVPTPSSHSRVGSIASNPPSTPPPSNITELQARTFKHLKRRNVRPFVEPNLHLIQCSGREHIEDRPSSNGNGVAHHSTLDKINSRLYIGIVCALTMQPKFLSLTISQEEGPSLLLDKTLLHFFGNSIQGDTDGDLVPIFLDLVDLPLESTGIVCGVAGKLVDEMRMNDLESTFGAELSYLSTARAGAVILSPEGSARALDTLQPLLDKESE
ncbi:ACT domain-domain-containing protein [Rutstroemia sp. NJR-2017a BVV2]|nr:ACT domain-domain-containing protein [Rutstroemia sp. NJR-2017a BVV2]